MRVSHLIFALAAGLVLAPGAAFAQWGVNTPSGTPITRNYIASRVTQFQSRDWGQCIGIEELAPNRAIGACGRIISQRVSRLHTAAAYFYRGQYRKELGETERAQADFDQAVALFGGVIATERTAFNYANRAGVFYYLENYPAALEDYDQALALNPDLALAHSRRADILFRQHDYAGAATAFDIAARLEPEAYEHQIGRCMARAAANAEAAMAAEACEAALRMSNNASEARAARGFLRFSQERYEDALQDFTAATRRADPSPNALAAYGEAVTRARLGQTEAQARAEQALAESHWLTVFAEAGLRP